MIMGFGASSSASQLGPRELPGWVCVVGGRLLHWVAVWQEETIPVGYCHEFALPRQDLHPGGSRGNLHGCDREVLAVGFCRTSSLRRINGNIPLAKGWLGSRHTWGLAPHNVCGSCQRSLTLTKSLQPPQHAQHRSGSMVGQEKWLGRVIFH